jgi:seryl-tRNA synthetase
MAISTGMNDMYELSGYLQSMNSRLMVLDRASITLAHQIEHYKVNTKENKDKHSKDLKSIKDDINQIKDDIRAVQIAILQIISGLKGSVKSEDLERFKKRIDTWAPETFVTRREVNRVIDEY